MNPGALGGTFGGIGLDSGGTFQDTGPSGIHAHPHLTQQLITPLGSPQLEKNRVVSRRSELLQEGPVQIAAAGRDRYDAGMNLLRSLIPAGVLVVSGVQLAILLAVAGLLLWIGWDLAAVLWRFLVGLTGLLT